MTREEERKEEKKVKERVLVENEREATESTEHESVYSLSLLSDCRFDPLGLSTTPDLLIYLKNNGKASITHALSFICCVVAAMTCFYVLPRCSLTPNPLYPPLQVRRPSDARRDA